MTSAWRSTRPSSAITTMVVDRRQRLRAADRTYQGTAGWSISRDQWTPAPPSRTPPVCMNSAHTTGFGTTRAPRAWHWPLSHSTATPDPPTATWLVLELTAAFADLSTAAGHAETLIAIDHCGDHQYGYVGGLGWDLETAGDDAVIAIRDAMRVGTLATINTAFWADKL